MPQSRIDIKNVNDKILKTENISKSKEKNLKKEENITSKILKNTENIKEEEFFPEGNIEMDKPAKIIKMKMIDEEICGLIDWIPRPDGTIPRSNYCPIKELKKRYLEMVCDFYEQKIKIRRG